MCFELTQVVDRIILLLLSFIHFESNYFDFLTFSTVTGSRTSGEISFTTCEKFDRQTKNYGARVNAGRKSLTEKYSKLILCVKAIFEQNGFVHMLNEERIVV